MSAIEKTCNSGEYKARETRLNALVDSHAQKILKNSMCMSKVELMQQVYLQA